MSSQNLNIALVTSYKKTNGEVYLLDEKKYCNFLMSKKINNIFTGDYCQYKINKNNVYLTKILKRKNYFLKPRIANVDVLLLFISKIDNNFDIKWFVKILLFYEMHNLKIKIIITKKDIKVEYEKLINDFICFFKKYNYDIFYINTLEIKKEFFEFLFKNEKIFFLAGKRGAGKSTFIKRLIINEKIIARNLNFQQYFSKNLTTNSNLYKIGNSWISDTPGFDKFSLNEEHLQANIAKALKIFRVNSKNCFFSDCFHVKEKNCYIKKMTKENYIFNMIYNNYLDIIKNSKKFKYSS